MNHVEIVNEHAAGSLTGRDAKDQPGGRSVQPTDLIEADIARGIDPEDARTTAGAGNEAVALLGEASRTQEGADRTGRGSRETADGTGRSCGATRDYRRVVGEDDRISRCNDVDEGRGQCIADQQAGAIVQAEAARGEAAKLLHLIAGAAGIPRQIDRTTRAAGQQIGDQRTGFRDRSGRDEVDAVRALHRAGDDDAAAGIDADCTGAEQAIDAQ